MIVYLRKAEEMLLAGATIKEISKKVGRTESTVHTAIKRHLPNVERRRYEIRSVESKQQFLESVVSSGESLNHAAARQSIPVSNAYYWYNKVPIGKCSRCGHSLVGGCCRTCTANFFRKS